MTVAWVARGRGLTARFGFFFRGIAEFLSWFIHLSLLLKKGGLGATGLEFAAAGPRAMPEPEPGMGMILLGPTVVWESWPYGPLS